VTLAVAFVGLALVLNSVIYTENLATRSEAAKASDAAKVHIDMVNGTERIISYTNENNDSSYARLRANAADVASKGRVEVESGLVRKTSQTAHAVVEAAAVEAVAATSSAVTARAAARAGIPDMGALPAGLPLAPVPGAWYATANAWSVGVRGSWETFTVRAEGGTPVGPGDGAAYVRTDESVAFDVNGDGRPDDVGANERVSFRAEATVGVVVPAGPRGVGDTAGDRDEQSPGWQTQPP
jgi:hypothetical protein